MLPLALLAFAGVVAAAVKLTSGPNLAHVAQGLKIPLPYVQLASKWAKRRGLPLEWVLATILAESGGRANATGDADGRSIGLMQVNTVAHGAELTAAGLTWNDMLDPAKNIEWGTKYLAGFRADVLQALGGRRPPAALDEIVRLAYKGPNAVISALHDGANPLNLSWAPAAVTNWRQRMRQVTALTRGALRA